MADLLQIIENLVTMLPAFRGLLSAVFWLTGVLFIISALRSAMRRSEMGPSQGTWMVPLAKFITGAAFIAFPSTVGAFLASFWGSPTAASPDAIFALAPSMTAAMDEGNGRIILTSITMIVQFVGLIGFARGLYLMNASASGTGQAKTFGPGLTFLIASTLAVNFPMFIGAIELLVTPPSA